MELPHLKLSLRKNGRLFGFGVSPNADWKIIFVSSAVLLVIVCIAGVWFFLQTYKGDITAGLNPSELGFNETLLRRIVLMYQERESKFLDIKGLTQFPVDPSL